MEHQATLKSLKYVEEIEHNNTERALEMNKT